MHPRSIDLPRTWSGVTKRSEWRGTHSLRYHLYVVTDGYQLPDGIHFPFGRDMDFNKHVGEVNVLYHFGLRNEAMASHTVVLSRNP